MVKPSEGKPQKQGKESDRLTFISHRMRRKQKLS